MAQSPPELARLQMSLREILTDSRGARVALRERPKVLAWISDAPPMDPATRLSVYGDAYFLRLLEALASDFPAVKRALGEEDFRLLAAHYLEANPSRSPTLADLGEAFPGFAEAHPLARKYPFLADLARLERDAMTRLFARRLPAFDPRALGDIPADDWGRVRLILDPTVLLLKAAWPVERLWRRRGLPPEAGGRALRRPRAQWLALYRDETWVRVLEVSRKEWALLSKIAQGAPLGEIFEGGGDSLQGAQVRRWFSAWIGGGLIKGAEVPAVPFK